LVPGPCTEKLLLEQKKGLTLFSRSDPDRIGQIDTSSKMSATLQQTESETYSKVNSAPTAFVAHSSEEDTTVSPRQTLTEPGSENRTKKAWQPVCGGSALNEKKVMIDQGPVGRTRALLGLECIA
jgi:hypothetical protein